jgi:hypothetical protein
MNDNSSGALGAPMVPPMVQEAKLVGTGSWGDSNQGTSVAISADGNTAVVGASNDDQGTGALWVFTRSHGKWTQQHKKLQGSDCLGASGLGTSVAISRDGNTIVTGGSGDQFNTGAAWIFTRTGGDWSKGHKLVANDGSGSSMQGAAVAISGDGNTVAVGGNGDDQAIGATWIYSRSGGAWKQQGSKLVGEYPGRAGQGSSVALSADGTTMIVGSSFEGSFNAPVWVFVKGQMSTRWQQQDSWLITNDSTETQPAQNTSVAVSADGNTFILGKDCDNNRTGAAWIFVRQDGKWKQYGSKLVASDAANPSEQGASVAISADGYTALVGGNADNSDVGAMWVWARFPAWHQKGSKLVGTGATQPALQGNAVALSADGSTALSGGPGDNGLVGATWVFVTATPA